MKVPEKYVKLTFSSSIADCIERFIAQQRNAGYIYNTQAKDLKRFDNFVIKQDCPPNTLPKEIVAAWIEHRPNEKTNTQRKRANLIKQLAQFMLSVGYEAYVPPITITRAVPRNYIPHIYTDDELARFFTAADSLPCHCGNRHLAAPLFFRMLYGCGLRESEARKLRLCDVDTETGTLAIKNSKLGKSRTIPMAPSLVQRCQDYIGQVHKHSNRGNYLFSPQSEEMYSRGAFLRMFMESPYHAGIPYSGKGIGPRMHDFRHTFAVHCLRKWVATGVDLTVTLPYLSAYMGHSDLRSSQYYLRLTAELFPHITNHLEKELGEIIPNGGNLHETN